MPRTDAELGATTDAVRAVHRVASKPTRADAWTTKRLPRIARQAQTASSLMFPDIRMTTGACSAGDSRRAGHGPSSIGMLIDRAAESHDSLGEERFRDQQADRSANGTCSIGLACGGRRLNKAGNVTRHGDSPRPPHLSTTVDRPRRVMSHQDEQTVCG